MEMKPKRATCFTLECMKMLCLIFGIINAVICLLVFLCSSAMLIYCLYVWIWNTWQGISYSIDNDESGWAYLFYILTSMAFILTAVTGLALFFAILLCIGIQNDNKRYIKSFLVFGVIVVSLSSVASLTYVLMMYQHADFTFNLLITFGFLFVYAGFLQLIHKTYFGTEYSKDVSGRLINASNDNESYGSN